MSPQFFAAVEALDSVFRDQKWPDTADEVQFDESALIELLRRHGVAQLDAEQLIESLITSGLCEPGKSFVHLSDVTRLSDGAVISSSTQHDRKLRISRSKWEEYRDSVQERDFGGGDGGIARLILAAQPSEKDRTHAAMLNKHDAVASWAEVAIDDLENIQGIRNEKRRRDAWNTAYACDFFELLILYARQNNLGDTSCLRQRPTDTAGFEAAKGMLREIALTARQRMVQREASGLDAANATPGQVEGGDGGSKRPGKESSRPSQNTRRGGADLKLLAELNKHHAFKDGGCLNFTPIGLNELARRADVPQSSAVNFFNRHFGKETGESRGRKKIKKGGYARYEESCTCGEKGTFITVMKIINGEMEPSVFLDAYTRGRSNDVPDPTGPRMQARPRRDKFQGRDWEDDDD